jgi:hypothetical protein
MWALGWFSENWSRAFYCGEIITMLDKVNKLRLELGIKPAPPTALQALQQYSEITDEFSQGQICNASKNVINRVLIITDDEGGTFTLPGQKKLNRRLKMRHQGVG